MKLRLSWPTGIVIALIAFMVFILSFVYKAAFIEKYDHHLVSEEYYNEELNYQEEIDKLENAGELEEDVHTKKTSLGLQIVFPSNLKTDDIGGTIYFKRMSNEKIDFSLPIELDSTILLIKDSTLVKGRWDLKIDWSYGGKLYLFKEKLMY